MSYTPLYSFPSTDNTTTTPLASGATYTGTFELNGAPWVQVSCKTDNGGTLYFDFSNDGTNVDTFPTDGFTIASGIHEYHTAQKGYRYFRVRLVNDTGAQSYLRLYTSYGWFDQGIAPIGFTIADDADAKVVKSVISGIGDTTATVTDHKALQVTQPAEGKTAFGEQSVAELTPIIQLVFPYNSVNSHIIDSRANNSGTVTVANSMLQVQSGASANSFGAALSKESVSYRAGQGILTRFTAIYTTGVANSTQLVGPGDLGEGFFFGYNGTSFGVMSRKGGAPEVRTLTITTASTTAEDITITLDSDALATVTITNSGNTTTTANEIAAEDYSSVGDGWVATAVGSTVVFTSWTSGSKTGTYSLSSATTAVGTFSQTLAGTSATDTWVAQASWNGLDKFDGNGITGVTLDPTKGNVYQIRFQYLGFGAVSFFIEDPDDGEMHLVHIIEYANANTTPSLDNPSLPFCMSAINTSNTSNLTVKSASAGFFVEGKQELIGVRHGHEAEITLGATAAETPITTIRGVEVFDSGYNRTKVKLLLIGASAEHTKPVAVKFYKDATLTDASFSALDSSSTIEADTSATAFSGGDFLFSIQLGKTGNQLVDVSNIDLGLWLMHGESITATISPKSGNAAEATVSIYLVELV